MQTPCLPPFEKELKYLFFLVSSTLGMLAGVVLSKPVALLSEQTSPRSIFYFFFPLSLWAALGAAWLSVFFWLRFQAWLWHPGSGSLLDAVCQSVPCPVLPLQRGCRPAGNEGMLFLRSCLHIITGTMVQSSSSSNPKHSCGFQKPYMTFLVLEKLRKEKSETGSWGRRIKPEKLHMWEGSWILMKETLDIHLQRIFLRKLW